MHQEVKERKTETCANGHADRQFVQQTGQGESREKRGTSTKARDERTVDRDRRHLGKGQIPALRPERAEILRSKRRAKECVARNGSESPGARKQIAHTEVQHETEPREQEK